MSQENTKNKKKIIIGVAALVLVMIALALVYVLCRPKAKEGTKHITIEVVDDQKAKTSYQLATDAEYLRQAMEELEKDGKKDFSFSGSEGQYGLMVETVNGVTADYGKDKSYWAFYVNGDYCQYGIEEQVVNDKDVFTIEYTISE